MCRDVGGVRSASAPAPRRPPPPAPHQPAREQRRAAGARGGGWRRLRAPANGSVYRRTGQSHGVSALLSFLVLPRAPRHLRRLRAAISPGSLREAGDPRGARDACGRVGGETKRVIVCVCLYVKYVHVVCVANKSSRYKRRRHTGKPVQRLFLAIAFSYTFKSFIPCSCCPSPPGGLWRCRAGRGSRRTCSSRSRTGRTSGRSSRPRRSDRLP